MDDLNDVAAGQWLGSVFVAVAKNRAVVLDDDETRVEAERAEELRQRAILRYLPGRAVHRQGDYPARSSPDHRLKYSG